MPDVLEIGDVQWLIARAADAGADQARVQRVAEQLLDEILDLQAWRAGDHDPRAQKALQLARRVQYAKATGATIQQLMARFNLSRSQIHRHLCRITSRDTSVRESPDQTS